MSRVRITSVAVALLAFLSGVPLVAQCVTPKCLEATKWHRNFTAVVLVESNLMKATTAAKAIEAAGGRVAIVGEQVILGWVEPKLRRALVGKVGIKLISSAPIDRHAVTSSAKPGHSGAQARLQVNYFNHVASGKMARDTEVALSLPPGNPLMNDALIPPQLARTASLGKLQITPSSNIAPPWTNEELRGSVRASMFQVESDGPASIFDWTSAQSSQIADQFFNSMVQWTAGANARGIPLYWYPSVYLAYDEYQPEGQKVPYNVKVGVEPVLGTSSEHYQWVNTVLTRTDTNYGVGGARPGGFPAAQPVTLSTVFESAEAYNEFIRTGQDYDFRPLWDRAFTVFVANNSGGPNRFAEPDGLSAFAYFGGPYIISLWNSGGWGPENYGIVAQHEAGHVFWACDEYAYSRHCQERGCGPCRLYGPRTWAANGNCDIASCPIRTPCIMHHNTEGAICSYTATQVGW